MLNRKTLIVIYNHTFTIIQCTERNKSQDNKYSNDVCNKLLCVSEKIVYYSAVHLMLNWFLCPPLIICDNDQAVSVLCQQ